MGNNQYEILLHYIRFKKYRHVHTSLKQMCTECTSTPVFPEFESMYVGHVHTCISVNYMCTKKKDITKKQHSYCFSPLVNELPADPKETCAVKG